MQVSTVQVKHVLRITKGTDDALWLNLHVNCNGHADMIPYKATEGQYIDAALQCEMRQTLLQWRNGDDD